MSKILAIDDRLDNLISIKALLRNMIPECEVITAQTGEEGIERAIKELPDTILLDINMPVMDGYEVCNKLKANSVTKHIPVIMITAVRTDSKSRVKGLEIGADVFISKPIDADELTSQVKVMLRIKKAEDKL
ncbi:MAG: hybrid sensor histidine kinase/response regulator, partial [Candidatus Nealsonbacteria bacterium]